MKTNKLSIQKKLKNYSALAGTMAAAATANAQIVVYTDVTPDSTVNQGGIYNLDLNHDAITDFQIMQQSGLYGGFVTYDAVGIFAMNAANSIDTAAGGGQGSVAALGVGVTVDSTLTWVDSAQAAAINPPTANGLAISVPTFAIYGGNFLGQTGQFAGLKFKIGTGIYYGWVRLDVAGDAKSFKVIDYAYTNNPNHSYSITGAVVGISEAALNNEVSIFAYNRNINIKLDPMVALEGTVAIADAAGKNISETAIQNAEMSIPMDQVKSGIYFVTVKQSSGSYTKRVFIK
jgi:hypothetical protein